MLGYEIFSRRGAEKDERARAIEEEDVARIEKDFYDQIKIVEEERDKNSAVCSLVKVLRWILRMIRQAGLWCARGNHYPQRS